jgi:hypothetical protein
MHCAPRRDTREGRSRRSNRVDRSLDLELVDDLLAHALGGLALGGRLHGVTLLGLGGGVVPRGLHGFERGLRALELILVDAERQALLRGQFVDSRLDGLHHSRYFRIQRFPLGLGGGQRGARLGLARGDGILQRADGLLQRRRTGQNVLVFLGFEAGLEPVVLRFHALEAVRCIFLRVFAHVLELGLDLVECFIGRAALPGASGHQRRGREHGQHHV